MPNTKSTREERILNMSGRSTTANQQMLQAINSITFEFNALLNSIPLFAKELIVSIIGVQNIPDDEKTLEDFYEYDYDDVLNTISEYLLHIIENIKIAEDILKDLQDEMNSQSDVDEEDASDIDAAVELAEELIAYGGGKHGTALALTQAVERPDRYTAEQLDTFINIVGGF